MFKYISIPVLLLSLSFGILYVYLVMPEPTHIYVYPTPDNVNILQYKDSANNCYEFTSQEMICPNNKEDIKIIPVQN